VPKLGPLRRPGPCGGQGVAATMTSQENSIMAEQVNLAEDIDSIRSRLLSIRDSL